MLLLTPRSLKSFTDFHNLAHMSIKGPFITKNNKNHSSVHYLILLWIREKQYYKTEGFTPK